MVNKKSQKDIDRVAGSLNGGRSSTYMYIDTFKHDQYLLVRIEQGHYSPDDEWGCAEFHLLNKYTLENYFIAWRDGNEEVEWQMRTHEIEELIGNTDIYRQIESCTIKADWWIINAKRWVANAVDSDYEGVCNVYCSYSYPSDAIGCPFDGFVEDGRGGMLFFIDYNDARRWVERENGKAYTLSANELDRPRYTIVYADLALYERATCTRVD